MWCNSPSVMPRWPPPAAIPMPGPGSPPGPIWLRDRRRASAQSMVGQRRRSVPKACSAPVASACARPNAPCFTGSVAETGSRLQSVEPTSKLPTSRSDSVNVSNSGGVQAAITAQSRNRRRRTANPDLGTGHLGSSRIVSRAATTCDADRMPASSRLSMIHRASWWAMPLASAATSTRNGPDSSGVRTLGPPLRCLRRHRATPACCCR